VVVTALAETSWISHPLLVENLLHTPHCIELEDNLLITSACVVPGATPAVPLTLDVVVFTLCKRRPGLCEMSSKSTQSWCVWRWRDTNTCISPSKFPSFVSTSRMFISKAMTFELQSEFAASVVPVLDSVLRLLVDTVSVEAVVAVLGDEDDIDSEVDTDESVDSDVDNDESVVPIPVVVAGPVDSAVVVGGAVDSGVLELDGDEAAVVEVLAEELDVEADESVVVGATVVEDDDADESVVVGATVVEDEDADDVLLVAASVEVVGGLVVVAASVTVVVGLAAAVVVAASVAVVVASSAEDVDTAAVAVVPP